MWNLQFEILIQSEKTRIHKSSFKNRKILGFDPYDEKK